MSMGRTKPARPERPARQNVPHNSPIERFKNMPSAERQRELSSLPAARAEELKRKLEQYDRMTPLQKQQAEWFSHLPPERQEGVRKAFQKFQKEPPERQQLMRDELTRLAAMQEEERQARLASAEFQSRYSKSERQILTGIADSLPSRE